MVRIVQVLFFSFLSIIFIGCSYKTYSGRYWIGTNSRSFIDSSTIEQNIIKIERVMREVASDFGFVEDKTNTKNYIR